MNDFEFLEHLEHLESKDWADEECRKLLGINLMNVMPCFNDSANKHSAGLVIRKIAVDKSVLCIHCMGSKTDPCDDDEKPCYLCGGTGRITELLKQKTIAEAEAFGHPPACSM